MMIGRAESPMITGVSIFTLNRQDNLFNGLVFSIQPKLGHS